MAGQPPLACPAPAVLAGLRRSPGGGHANIAERIHVDAFRKAAGYPHVLFLLGRPVARLIRSRRYSAAWASAERCDLTRILEWLIRAFRCPATVKGPPAAGPFS